MTPRVALCVATLRRPEGLRALLASVDAMELDDDEAKLFVVVVDNDADGSARAVVEAEGARFPRVYAVEPERNISRARNRGVALALARGCDWIAFTDDDETVELEWIRELLADAERFGADVVQGVIRSRCPEGTPRWMDQPLFFGGPVRPAGLPITVATTGNVLVRAALLAGGEPFDPRFGVTGGSDSHLFMRLHRAGARMVMSGKAVSYEIVPAARTRPAWVLRRAFRIGNTAMLCERTLPDGRPASRLARAGLRLAWGGASLPAGAVVGRGAALRALWNVAYGLGACAGLAGFRYREYTPPQGG